MLPAFQRIAIQAERYPDMVFNNLYHLIDYELLLEAYRQTRKDAAAWGGQGHGKGVCEGPGG